MSRTRKLIMLMAGLLVGTLAIPIAAFSAANSDSASGIAVIETGNRCRTVDARMDVTSGTKVAATVVTNTASASVQRVVRFAAADEFRICLGKVATKNTKVSWIAHNGARLTNGSHAHDGRYYTESEVDALLGTAGDDYANVIVVAAAGGDFTTVTAAMNAIGTDPDYPAASASNRYLVWVAPGVYENEDIDMQPYVDIEGSGQGITVLRSVGGAGGITPDAATVVGADDAELRDLTVEIEAAAPANWTHAIYTASRTTFRNVTASSTGGSRARGLMVTTGGAPVMIDVIVLANGASVSNLGLDLVDATAIADGLFADASGGTVANGIFINSATSEVQFENVTTRVSGATSENVGLSTNLSDVTLEGYRSTVVGDAGLTYGLWCDDEGESLKVLGSTIYVENASSTGVAVGVNGVDCNLEMRNSVVDAVASGGQAFGVRHVQSDSVQPADVTIADVELRAESSGSSAYGLSISSTGGSPAGTFGRVTDLNARATGGSSSVNTWAISHAAAGEVQYRGLSLVAGGQANFMYGIKAEDGTPRFDDVVIDVVGTAETTVFGVELLTDNSTVTNARVKAVNLGSGSGHDAVGIKANGASGVAFTDVTAYAEAETNVWGVDLTSADTTLNGVDAMAVGAPGEIVHGARCAGGSAEIRQSILRSQTANIVSYGFQSFDCTSTVTGSELSGATYGLYVFANVGGASNMVRDSYITGATTVRTVTEGEAVVVQSQLDGGAASSSGPNDIQECTAVTYNSGGTELFAATTSDPCP